MCSAVLLASGCGKKQEPPASPVAASEPSAPAATAPAPAPAAAPVAPAATAAENATSTDLTGLTQALRKYYFETRKVPKTFEEFVAARSIQVPAAPPGKKFAIDTHRLEVVLVNR